ncbi:hypothetical protein CLAFUW4_03211 [Fulvia fulva]|uniref:Uncharacterized protein n=1 Tax=Passalora fulva TaxID=5499 RepID=A0A9Q8L9R8_PASFU|nr:uncharacterized protein CLAFUR5_03194 [Fulvia fulva]KAK4631336.1 hypothetical protein CLAFUR4_03200 [Fulvia fulva]KAK4632766.1 hypothetical protein CLAFUR0_03204 [Fulvia fulva]UJO13407.1 hypothetical protein CLAFUR5_03194 [Fulvia fulva]WPV11906.1 hypothetical protein CLAFUW4_03211 [Fulvia fulva]WPV25694.1 hypothetical protein CLAFUW7_03204 [Fulvia fulva]
MQDNEDMEYHSSIDQLESHQIGDDEDDGQTWTAPDSGAASIIITSEGWEATERPGASSDV